MTQKLIEAARQALEVLENLPALSWIPEKERDAFNAITALREALAEQAEQEPVALVSALYPDGVEWFKCVPEGTKLYAHPVRTKELTDDEIDEIGKSMPYPVDAMAFIRAVIAADREKNRGC